MLQLTFDCALWTGQEIVGTMWWVTLGCDKPLGPLVGRRRSTEELRSLTAEKSAHLVLSTIPHIHLTPHNQSCAPSCSDASTPRWPVCNAWPKSYIGTANKLLLLLTPQSMVRQSARSERDSWSSLALSAVSIGPVGSMCWHIWCEV